MAGSSFSVGESVRVLSGSFEGIEGTVVPSVDAARASGTVILSTNVEAIPVAISVILDGHEMTVRVPPELLVRV